ncbi:hypothetical protein [Streptococcus lactarius]|uniref:Uncharacterized protein n=1 Tax=Streptococcus lactarius TaxID=684066 RepID=A0A9X1BBK6_9STRE|nr:hypothetical protein [Streptococcus lactarius]MBK4780528.1 hypothetical protein [Streptococcus lactarius]QUB38287.1 hypothetical protein J4854_06980 [Streptococcus lactarius]
MNQKDWVDHFEALYNRKPSMQEFQEAREKGEFVVNKPDTPASAPVAPQPQVQPTGPSGYNQPLASPKKPRFHKKTVTGLSIAGLVAVIALVCFFFFSSGPDLDGIWLNPNLAPVAYELKGKKQTINMLYSINKIIKGNEAKKEFNEKLSSYDLSNLKNLADVDKKFQLKTKEVVIVKADKNVRYNLLQADGTNVIIDQDFKALKYNDSSVSEFKKQVVFQKIEFPKVLVGKWKFYEDGTYTISDHGIISKSGSKEKGFTLFYSLTDLKRLNKYNKDDDYSDSKLKSQFEHIQKAIKKQGYTVTSPDEVYKMNYTNYLVPVNGGKTLIALDDDFKIVNKIQKVE